MVYAIEQGIYIQTPVKLLADPKVANHIESSAGNHSMDQAEPFADSNVSSVDKMAQQYRPAYHSPQDQSQAVIVLNQYLGTSKATAILSRYYAGLLAFVNKQLEPTAIIRASDIMRSRLNKPIANTAINELISKTVTSLITKVDIGSIAVVICQPVFNAISKIHHNNTLPAIVSHNHLLAISVNQDPIELLI